MITFAESIIIPLAMFEKCRFSKEESTEPVLLEEEKKLLANDAPSTKASKILFDEKITNAGDKIKMYNQHKRLHFDPKKKPILVKEDKNTTEKNVYNVEHENDISSISQLFSLSLQPFVRSILEKISDNKDIISWENCFEIIIRGAKYPGSNIIDLMRYVMNIKTISRESDLPTALQPFLRALEAINVPKSWMKIPRKSTRWESLV